MSLSARVKYIQIGVQTKQRQQLIRVSQTEHKRFGEIIQAVDVLKDIFVLS